MKQGKAGVESPVREYAARTDVGRVRNRNEDAYLVMPESGLYLVADGMGGHRRGDVAAGLCTDAVRDWFSRKVGPRSRDLVAGALTALGARTRPGERELLAALEYANRMIFEMSASSMNFRGMGTTVVGALFEGDTLFVVYSGDSRIYRLRKGRLEVLSRDHSLLNEYLRLKMIEPGDARSFPHRNVIMKALGLKEKAEVDFFRRKVQPGDLYLLCSDGLNDMLEDSLIRGILNDPDLDLEQRADRLVQRALEAGGVDNVTVLLVQT
ncbi:serine/threonine-protein phosphatase [Myxococcota bacterium]|nr:serine/threonine-protein phosphatase [Myxococcota bacterium]